jgi:hypothetical protein
MGQWLILGLAGLAFTTAGCGSPPPVSQAQATGPSLGQSTPESQFRMLVDRSTLNVPSADNTAANDTLKAYINEICVRRVYLRCIRTNGVQAYRVCLRRGIYCARLVHERFAHHGLGSGS